MAAARAGAWRQLAALRPGEAVDLVTEVGTAMQDPKVNIRNLNAFFSSQAKKKFPDIFERVRGLEQALKEGPDAGGAHTRQCGGFDQGLPCSCGQLEH